MASVPLFHPYLFHLLSFYSDSDYFTQILIPYVIGAIDIQNERRVWVKSLGVKSQRLRFILFGVKSLIKPILRSIYPLKYNKKICL